MGKIIVMDTIVTIKSMRTMEPKDYINNENYGNTELWKQ